MQVILVAVIIVLVLLALVALLPGKETPLAREGGVAVAPPPTTSAGPAGGASSAATTGSGDSGAAVDQGSGAAAVDNPVPTRNRGTGGGGSSDTDGTSTSSRGTGSTSSATSSSATNGTPGSSTGNSGGAAAYRPQPAVQGRLFLVIDDVGYNLYQLKPFLALPMDMTISVLPQLTYSARAASAAAKAGKEVILHLPMEALNEQNPGPGTINVDMSDSEIEAMVDRDIQTVPGIIGVNNHMGSRATSDVRVMNLVLGDLAARHLFFLDSRTTTSTVAPQVAARYGLPFAERQVFLDDIDTADAIRTQLQTAARLALEHGTAVMIGHVWSAHLVAVLQAEYASLRSRGIMFDKLSAIVRPIVHTATQ